MKASSDFELFVQNLETHEKPATLLRRKVIELGGTWHDMDVTALFEIHFMGVAASGWGAEDATQNWIKAARRTVSVQNAASQQISPCNAALQHLLSPLQREHTQLKGTTDDKSRRHDKSIQRYDGRISN